MKRAQRNHLQTWVNGESAADCYDPQNRFPGGYVLPQMHHRTGIVESQKVRLQPLPGAGA